MWVRGRSPAGQPGSLLHTCADAGPSLSTELSGLHFWGWAGFCDECTEPGQGSGQYGVIGAQ